MKRRFPVLLAAITAALGTTGMAAAPPPPSTTPPPATQDQAIQALPEVTETVTSDPGVRNGREIFADFQQGLADPGCDTSHSDPKWERHFARAPLRMANPDEDVLALFGYVVDQLRAADMPTEFALIPFVESGYRPGARSGGGPAGLWQFVPATARNHKVPISRGYDGRLSAVDSTRAAVRYLKTLYGMFGGDWRLAVMAYNAGEYRILQSMRSAGMNAQNAHPSKLPGLSTVTYQYVDKLHALACVLDKAQSDGNLLTTLDRPVPVLAASTLPTGTTLEQWSRQHALDPVMVARLNPAVKPGRAITHDNRRVLTPLTEVGEVLDESSSVADADDMPAPMLATAQASAASADDSDDPAAAPKSRTHTVRSGESAWTIARRYGITVKALLSRNGLDRNSVLKPGMVLAFDSP